MAAQIPETVDLSKYVETRLMGDRPHVRGKRIPIAHIAITARDNAYTVSKLMDSFTLSEEEVLAALLYYREHQAEIDAQMSRDQQDWDELYEQRGRK